MNERIPLSRLAPALALTLIGCGLFGPNLPPEIELVSPLGSERFSIGDTVEVEVTASDPDGRVERVVLYVNDEFTGEDESPPYTFEWDTSGSDRLYNTLLVVARDDEGDSTADTGIVEVAWVYRRPEATGDGWETAEAADLGMNEDSLVALMNRIRGSPHHLIHSVLIVVQGRLALEEYFHGLTHPTRGSQPISFGRDTVHSLSSTTKSFTSALVGIAIGQGLITGVDEPVWEFFPELSDLAEGEKATITLRDLITMSPGLQWDEDTYPFLDPRNDIGRMQRAEDPWRFYLSRPLVSSPGTSFLYSEGSINVVGEVIKRASGLRLDEFAERYLFQPLDISPTWWFVVRPDIGFVWASGDLRLRPRDMAKFGQLYSQGGVWAGEQVVPREWVEASVVPRFTFPETPLGDVGYGYAWWVPNASHGAGAFAARGWGAQEITVVPERQLVVVVTGGAYYEWPIMWPHQMIERYVLPSFDGVPGPK